jgi:uncharacterized protein
MKFDWILAFLALAGAGTGAAHACETGLYQSPDHKLGAAIVHTQDGAVRYTLTNGERGGVGEAGALLACTGGYIRTASGAHSGDVWNRVPLRMTETHFDSHGTRLSGVLIEPPTPGPHPLAVFVHGSEHYSPRELYYPYIFAANGVSVFAYDKRGTARSEGEYTQNFELLADDAAEALKQARRLAAGRYSRAGFFGGSQGGWVAPLAATRSPADFVAVGFGLISSPIEEDRDQVVDDLRQKGFGGRDISEALELASAASKIAASHFTTGFEEFAALKARYSRRPWFRDVKGEYTGAMLQLSDRDLRRIGGALFDNVELIWNYDSAAVIRNLRVPLLWVIAEDDREAPPAVTLERLSALRRAGANVTIYSFPNTDHGIYQFVQAPDGSRTITRVAPGYFRLVTDWIKGSMVKSYGTARKR